VAILVFTAPIGDGYAPQPLFTVVNDW
jgi:hypothetical protein